MKTINMTKKLAITAGGILVLAGMAANAQLLSSESFSGYTTGTLLRNSAPSPTVAGYTGNWTAVDWGDAGPGVIAGSLSYGGVGYSAGTGNHVGVAADAAGIAQATSGRVSRALDSSTTVTSSTVGTLYFSFLFQSGQEHGSTVYQVLSLHTGASGDPTPRAFVCGLTSNGGQSGNQYDFGINENYYNFGVSADANVHLFVAEFNFSATANSDSVTVWLDPTLGAGNPTGGVTVSAQNLTFDNLDLSDYSGNSANWGNIRFGTTFDSVTTIAPVPEPSSLALCGLGISALLFFRRKPQA